MILNTVRARLLPRRSKSTGFWRRTATCGVLVSALGIAAASTPASAQTAAPSQLDTMKAQQAFLRGQQLFKMKQFEKALEQFELSYGTVKSPNSHLYIARCMLELGRNVDAYEEFLAVETEALEMAKENDKYAPTAESARSEANDVMSTISLLTITVNNGQTGAKLRLNGSIIPRTDWGKQMALEPADVEVVLETPLQPEVKESASLAAGDQKEIVLDGAPPAPEAPPPPPPKKEPEPEDGSMSPFLPLGIAATGIGVAGGILFGVAGSLSNSTFSDLETRCGTAPCPASEQDTIDSGRTEQTLANVGLIVGAVGLAAGATFFVLAATDDGDSQVGGVTVDVGPTGAALRGSF